jgi:hypothetical protein
MAKYEGETMERIPPILESDDKEIILVTHDECIFYFNENEVYGRNQENCHYAKKEMDVQ